MLENRAPKLKMRTKEKKHKQTIRDNDSRLVNDTKHEQPMPAPSDMKERSPHITTITADEGEKKRQNVKTKRLKT